MPRPSDWEDDMRRGLAVIASRSESLSRFMSAYARLARLPQPTLAPVDISALVRRVVGLETRVPLTLTLGPDLTIRADSDQLEQLLINLIRNAADASLETGGECPRRLAEADHPAWSSGCVMKGTDCPTPPTSSFRSSRRSPAVRVSVWC